MFGIYCFGKTVRVRDQNPFEGHEYQCSPLLVDTMKHIEVTQFLNLNRMRIGIIRKRASPFFSQLLFLLFTFSQAVADDPLDISLSEISVAILIVSLITVL